MKIYVNDISVELAAGMTVRHALIAALGTQASLEQLSVSDKWGNRVGLDGALIEGDRIEAVDGLPGDEHE